MKGRGIGQEEKGKGRGREMGGYGKGGIDFGFFGVKS